MAQRMEDRLEHMIIRLNGISETIESSFSEKQLDLFTQNLDKWSKALRDGR